MSPLRSFAPARPGWCPGAGRSFRFLILACLPLVGWAARAPKAPPPPAPSAASTTPGAGEWDTIPFSLIPLALQKDPHVDLSVLTEMTADGRRTPPPTPAHPTYYVSLNRKMDQEGDIVAGEEPPSLEVLNRTLEKALATTGYLPASSGHPAGLVIAFRWGSFNQLTFTQSDDDLELQNLMERAALVGGMPFSVEMMRAYRLGGPVFRAFRNRTAKTDWLVTRSMGNLYFMIASAYDYAAANQGQMKLLWRTKMTTSSRGVGMGEAIPTLVSSSGAFFGHETDGPSRLNRPIIRNGTVEIGPSQVIPEAPGSR